MIINSENKFEIIRANLKQLKGCKFVSIMGYRNAAGELSNYLFNIGTNYQAALDHDMYYVQNYKPSNEMEAQARLELMVSFLDRNTTSKSDSKYVIINKGLKIHVEKLEAYVFGNLVQKTIIQPIVKRERKSNELTLAKNKIRDGFKTKSYRLFKIENIKEIHVNKENLIFNL